MAFENIDVNLLKSDLSNFKASLNNEISNHLMEEFNNSWIADSKNHLQTALQKLTGEKYFNLTSQIDQYLNVTTLIEEYKNLKQQNIECQKQINNLQPHIYKRVYYDDSFLDSNGCVHTETKWYDTEDWNVKNQISQFNEKINTNTSNMEVLKSRIDSLL